jgi:hypothetical protein
LTKYRLQWVVHLKRIRLIGLFYKMYRPGLFYSLVMLFGLLSEANLKKEDTYNKYDAGERVRYLLFYN